MSWSSTTLHLAEDEKENPCTVELIADHLSKTIFISELIIALSFINVSLPFQCNRLLRWCPAPDCNNVIRVESVQARPVTCSCSYTFCFSCGEAWHEPVPCLQLKKWTKQIEGNSATLIWISANTKVRHLDNTFYIIRFYRRDQWIWIIFKILVLTSYVRNIGVSSPNIDKW